MTVCRINNTSLPVLQINAYFYGVQVYSLEIGLFCKVGSSFI